jgi:hypothetical protein
MRANVEVSFSPAPCWIQVGFFLQGIKQRRFIRYEITLTSGGVIGAT